MTSPQRALTLALLLTTSAHATEHDWPAKPRTQGDEPRVSFSLSNRTGIAKAPFVTGAFPEVSGFASVFTPAAGVRLFPYAWLYAQLPITYVRLDFPAGAQVGEAAIGNLELALEHGIELRPTSRLGLLAAFLAPTANHGPEKSLLDNRALALAGAINGPENSSLLMPGAMGLRFGASIEHPQGPFQFRASLDVPLLIRISHASLPEDTMTHTFGVTPVLGLKAAWWTKSWFGASLGAAVIAEAVRLQEPSRDGDRSQRLQPIVQPSLHFQLGHRIRLNLDGNVPVGGALGGNAWSIGPSGRLEL